MSATRLAPRTIVRMSAALSEPGHLVGRTGYRTLCGATLTATLAPGIALTCHACCAIAAQPR